MAYGIGSMAAFVGVTPPVSIQDAPRPWRPDLFVLLYGLGYGALGPVDAAVTADPFPGKHPGTILGGLGAGYRLGGAFGALMAGYLSDRLGHDVMLFALV